MLDALIFDCDGVLAETEADGHRVAFNQVFQQEGIDAFWSAEEYGRLIQINGGKERMAYYFGRDPEKYPPSVFTAEYIAALFGKKVKIFNCLCRNLPARPGVKRLMLEAAAQKKQVFICSTAHEGSVAALAMSILGPDWNSVITHIFAGDMVKRKKPAPDIYLLAEREYGLDTSRCVVVEDSRNGMLAAKAAGMCCLVTMSQYSRGEDFTEADAVVDCLGDPQTFCHVQRGLPHHTGMVDLNALEYLLRQRGKQPPADI